MASSTLFSGHSAGLCDLSFSPSGSTFVTCGRDGSAIEHKFPIDGDQPDSLHEYESTGFTTVEMSHDGKRIVSGHTDNVVRVWAHRSDTGDILTRFTSPVTHAVWSPDDSMVAAASNGESGIKLVTTGEKTSTHVLRGHDGGVKRLAWDPKGQLLASVGVDGVVRVWDVSKPESATSHVVEGYRIKHKGETSPCSIDWSRDGSLLLISGRPQAAVVKRGTWKVASMLGGSSSTTDTCHAFFSPQLTPGYAVVIDMDGNMSLYDTATSKLTKTLASVEGLVTAAEWSPVANQVVTVLISADLKVVDDVMPTDDWEAHANPNAKATKSLKRKAGAVPDKATGAKSLKRFVDDEAGSVDDEDEDDAADDVDQAAEEDAVEGGKATAAVIAEPEADEDATVGRMLESTMMGRPAVPQPVDPGSTPPGPGRRFLAYNMVGMVVSSEDGLQSSIEIEFHDTSKHRKTRFINHLLFDRAALAEHGAVFACGNQEGVESTVMFKSLDSQLISKSDWQLKISEGRDIEAVALALGATWVAVGTSAHVVRLFSLTGVQLAVMALPGPLVAMAGSGETLGIVYRDAGSWGHTLHYKIISVRQRSALASGMLPLMPGSELVWTGIDDRDRFVFCDNKSRLAAIGCEFGGVGVPICDVSGQLKTKNERVWPIAVSHGRFMFVIRKNEHDWPVPGRRVVQHSMPLRIPVLGDNAILNNIEETRLGLYMDIAAADQADDDETVEELQMDLDKNTLKALQVACKDGASARGLELAGSLNLPKSMVIAQGVASRMNLSVLDDRISQLYEERFAGGDSESESESEEDGEDEVDGVEAAAMEDEEPFELAGDADADEHHRQADEARRDAGSNGSASDAGDSDEDTPTLALDKTANNKGPKGLHRQPVNGFSKQVSTTRPRRANPFGTRQEKAPTSADGGGSLFGALKNIQSSSKGVRVAPKGGEGKKQRRPGSQPKLFQSRAK